MWTQLAISGFAFTTAGMLHAPGAAGAKRKNQQKTSKHSYKSSFEPSLRIDDVVKSLNSVVCLEKTKQIGPVLYVLLSKVQIMVLKLFLCHYVHYVWVQFWLIVRVLVWAFMLTQTKLHCLRLLSGGPAYGCKRKSKDSTNVLVLV